MMEFESVLLGLSVLNVSPGERASGKALQSHREVRSPIVRQEYRELWSQLVHRQSEVEKSAVLSFILDHNGVETLSVNQTKRISLDPGRNHVIAWVGNHFAFCSKRGAWIEVEDIHTCRTFGLRIACLKQEPPDSVRCFSN